MVHCILCAVGKQRGTHMELLWTVFLLVCAAVGVYFAIAAIFFLVVMAIVLGSLGAANALIGIPGLILGQYVQQGFKPPQPANAPANLQEMQEIQQRMNEELFEVQKRYFWFSLVQMIFST